MKQNRQPHYNMQGTMSDKEMAQKFRDRETYEAIKAFNDFENSMMSPITLFMDSAYYFNEQGGITFYKYKILKYRKRFPDDPVINWLEDEEAVERAKTNCDRSNNITHYEIIQVETPYIPPGLKVQSPDEVEAIERDMLFRQEITDNELGYIAAMQMITDVELNTLEMIGGVINAG